MAKWRIAFIPGDGIGPEVGEAALKVLEAVQDAVKGLTLEVVKVEAGDNALTKYGTPLPEETVKVILKESDACLKGPVGETAADVIVKLRIMLDLYANIRPFKSRPGAPCLRPDIDFVIVRENTEDLYKGYEFELNRGETAVALRVISRLGSERIAKQAFELARSRALKRRVTAVHKANVMRLTCGLFAKTCREVAKSYPDIAYNEMYVDACAMELIRCPHEFDVLVTTNMFGDILSDEAAALVGGLGIAPAANIGDRYAIFEPVHGSAPKYAGKGVANPCSMILSAAMMLEWLNEREAAKLIDNAVNETLKEGKTLTPDLGGKSRTDELAAEIARKVREGLTN